MSGSYPATLMLVPQGQSPELLQPLLLWTLQKNWQPMFKQVP